MITADREPRAASTAPAGVGLDAGTARPGPGPPASPVPFGPFWASSCGSRGVGRKGSSTGGVGSVFTPGSIYPVFLPPSPLEKLSPGKTVCRVLAKARRGYPAEGRKGMRWLLTGLLDLGGAGRKKGDRPSPVPAANTLSAHLEPPP